jgi:hypothetical protein
MTHTPVTPRAGQSIRVPTMWDWHSAPSRPPGRSPSGGSARQPSRLLLALIAAVYVGFAVANGRPTVIAVESTVAGAFVLLAAAGVTGPAWLLVLGCAGR